MLRSLLFLSAKDWTTAENAKARSRFNHIRRVLESANWAAFECTPSMCGIALLIMIINPDRESLARDFDPINSVDYAVMD